MPPSPRALVLTAGRAIERTVAGLFVHHAFDHAAAMAFYFFLSLFPLLGFVGYVLAQIAVVNGAEAALSPLYALMPDSAAASVREELERMAQGDASLAPISLPMFVYLTSSGTHNLMDLLEVATGATPRPWLRQRTIAIAWNAGLVVGLALGAWAFLAASDATHDLRAFAARLLHGSLPGASGLAVLGGLGVGSALALALFFRIAVNHPPGVARRVLPGAVVAILGFGLVTWGFGLWVRTLARYAIYYGSLAAVAVLLIWLYLGSLALLIGAEVNAQLEGLRPRYSLRR